MPDIAFARAIKALVCEYYHKRTDSFYLPENVIKNKLSQMAQRAYRKTKQLSWSHLTHYVGRTNIVDTIGLLLYSFHWMKELKDNSRKPIIFVQNLRGVTASNVSPFSNLLNYCQVVAVLDSDYQHLRHMKTLRNHFQTILELPPLPTDACREIAKRWLEKNPDVCFENEKTKSLFEIFWKQKNIKNCCFL